MRRRGSLVAARRSPVARLAYVCRSLAAAGWRIARGRSPGGVLAGPRRGGERTKGGVGDREILVGHPD